MRVSNVERDPALRAARLRVARHPARLLHGQPRGRADHVAGVRLRRRRRRDPRHRDLVRRDGGRGRHARRARCSRRSCRRRLCSTPATAASCPRSRRGRHLELVLRWFAQALDDAGTTLGDIERVAVTQGPGLVGALLVGISAAKAIAWSRRLPLVPVDHLDGHVASLYLGPSPLEPPFLCLLASGGHTLLLAVREHGRSERLGDDARRRGRRGVRQGRAAARPRLPGRRRDRSARAGGGSRSVPVSRRPRRGPRLLVLGAEDRAALHRARPRRRGGRAPEGRSRGVVPARDRPRARGAGSARPPNRRVSSGSRSSAASRRTRRSARRFPTPASPLSSSARTMRR